MNDDTSPQAGTAAAGRCTFGVCLAGDELVFSAAHFLAITPERCESLHGHNYRVAAELFGRLGGEHYLIDFAVVRETLRGILRELDHRVLLPAVHPNLTIRQSDTEVEVSYAGRRWVFPSDDCLLLPLASTTAELLAQYIACRLVERLSGDCRSLVSRVRVSVEECPGQTAVCQLDPS